MQDFRQGFYFRFTANDASKLFYLLIIGEVFLVATYLFNAWFPLPSTIFALIDLDAEAAISSWFSSLQLGLIGALLLLNSHSLYKNNGKIDGFFISLGLVFIFLSMDEAAEFHEKITQAFSYREWAPSFKGNHGVWIPLYVFMAVSFLIIFRQKLIAIFRARERECQMILAGVGIIFLGAICLEIASYQYLRSEIPTLLDTLEIAAEEFLEMAGGSLIFYATILLTLKSEMN